jgi:hypothetical protein
MCHTETLTDVPATKHKFRLKCRIRRTKDCLPEIIEAVVCMGYGRGMARLSAFCSSFVFVRVVYAIFDCGSKTFQTVDLFFF